MNTEFQTSHASSKIQGQKQGQEGAFTKTVERQTSKIPSITYLVLAGGAVALAIGLAATQKNKGMANFVGLWVPSLLLIGVYNKLVKVEGSDQVSKPTIH